MSYIAQLEQQKKAQALRAEAALASRLAAAAELDATRAHHVTAIIEAAARCRTAPGLESLEDLASEILAARVWTESLPAITRNGSTLPRTLGWGPKAFISLSICLVAGYGNVRGLVDAAEDRLHLVNLGGTVIAKTVQRAIETPTADNCQRALAVLDVYLDAVELAVHGDGSRSVICLKVASDSMVLKSSRGAIDAPRGFNYQEMYRRAEAVA